jgi:hypothetical protein
MTPSLFHWLPRILCIAAILFISMFAADAFESGLTFWQQLDALFMHLIPSFILLLFFLIAWKWERLGGFLFILIGLGLSPFIYTHNFEMNQSFWISLGVVLLINFPFVLVGILFLVSHHLSKKTHIVAS